MEERKGLFWERKDVKSERVDWWQRDFKVRVSECSEERILEGASSNGGFASFDWI